MGILPTILSLPVRPGLYSGSDVEAGKTLILGNNALSFEQVRRLLQTSGIQANLLVIDTYGVEPGHAEAKNLYEAERIGQALRQCPPGSQQEPVLLYGSETTKEYAAALDKACLRRVQVVSSADRIQARPQSEEKRQAKGPTLAQPVPFEMKALSLLQRLRQGLMIALLLTALEVVLLAVWGLWRLWPLVPVTLGLGIVLPLLYEVLPLPWGVLRGILWGGLLAVMWYGLSQFVWLVEPEVARRWALAGLGLSTWIGRGIYRPWRSLAPETVIAIMVSIAAGAVGLL